jgi:hypothetical protein
VAIPVNEKVDFMMRKLATGVYRPLFWSRYKAIDKNRTFRAEWANVLGKFEMHEIRDGLAGWVKDHGVDQLPEPKAFADYLRPKHTPESRKAIASIRMFLE